MAFSWEGAYSGGPLDSMGGSVRMSNVGRQVAVKLNPA